METVRKYYRHSGSRQKGYIKALINWTPFFLQAVYNKFGMDGRFTVNEIIYLFRHYSSETSARLKFYRLYKNNWFVREKDEETGVYAYQFSNAGIEYCKEWGGFNYNGPLLWSIKPKVNEKIVVEKQIINQDRYLGEV